MTVQEIYAITPNQSGWRKLPSGVVVKLGNDVELGNDVTLGYGVELGNGVKLGNGVTLGDGVTLGNGVKLGNTPLAIQGTRHLATNGEPGKIQIGCVVYTFAVWKRHFKEIGKAQNYTPAQIKEYGKIIEFIIKNGKKK